MKCRVTIHFTVFLWSLFLAVAPSRAESFRLSVPNEPPTLDWNLATDNVSYRIVNNLMEGLTQFDESLRPIPALAKSWEISSDQMTYRFALRSDVRWTDGVPFTAKHIVDSWQRLLDPRTAAEYAYFLYDIVGAKEFNAGRLKDPSALGFRALDDLTLEVRLRKPAAYFLSLVSFMVTFPTRLDVIQAYGDRWTEPAHMVSLGPYRLASWRHEYKLVLERNPTFFEGPPPVSPIEIFILNDKMTSLALFETGALDMSELAPIALARLKNHPALHRSVILRGTYFGFDVRAAPFHDPRVRQAFSLAVNREEFPRILHGGEKPTASWIPSGMFGSNASIGLHYNPDRARSLLAEAGYPNGKGFPAVRASYNTDALNRLVAENLQQQWKRELGVEVLLDHQEWKVYLQNLLRKPSPLFRMGWGADYPDPDNFMNLFTSSSGNNHTRWSDVRFDHLIEQAAGEMNSNKRQQLYDEAQRLLVEEGAAIIPLFETTTVYLLNPQFAGFRVDALGDWELKRVRLSRNAL